MEFGWRAQMLYLESIGARVQRREGVGAMPFLTDERHLILACTFEPIQRPRDLASLLDTRAGIVEHGLFLGIATDVLVGDDQGGVRHLCRGGAVR